MSLTWNASPSSTVKGYFLYQGTTSGVYSNKFDAGTNTSFALAGLVSGTTNFFATTAYDAARVESGKTTELAYVVPGLLTLSRGGTNGAMRIQFPVAPMHAYELQSSTNLASWTSLWLTPTQNFNTNIEYDEPVNSGVPAKYFRLLIH